jgi:hypothetical protein
MYNLFTETMLETANHIDLREEFFQYGNLQGPRTYLSATYFVTPGIALKAYNEDWFVHSNNTGNIATTPTPDETFGLAAKFKTLRGYVLLDVAHRKSLESYQTALLTAEYLLLHDINARIDVGYKQLANDTQFLYMGGYNNYLSGQLQYTISSRDKLNFTLARKYFYTQDNHYLSSGNVEELDFEHFFWQEYPDFSLLFYGKGTQYYPTNSPLKGSILKLLPTDSDGDVDTNVDQVITQTNTEFGITAQVGMNYLEDYTHSWKPFTSATLLYTSDSQIGWIYNLGIAGTVIGRDHLAFYYEVSSNQGPGVQNEFLLGMSYRYYF